MVIFSKISQFAAYLIGKRHELLDLRYRDILMGKTILRIHQDYVRKQLVKIPLRSVCLLHGLNRANSLRVLDERMRQLKLHQDEILSCQEVSKEVLDKIMPSVSGVKVVSNAKGGYIAFEGNGRVCALQKVLAGHDGVLVEVEQYVLAKPGKILKNLNRIRKLNNLA